MKYTYLYITLLLTTISCQPTYDSAALGVAMSTPDMALKEVKNAIDQAVMHLDASQLDTIVNSDYYNGVAYDYTIYKINNVPVKVKSKLKAVTYTIESSYYLYNNKPYYIYGTMRDQDRASGNYTHQIITTYLNENKVLSRLRKTAVNQENRASDLTNLALVDITNTIYAPELDAENRYKEVMTILGTPVE